MTNIPRDLSAIMDCKARILRLSEQFQKELNFLNDLLDLGSTPKAKRRGNLEICFANFTATWDGSPVRFTATEFQVVYLLLSRPGIVSTRSDILDRYFDLDSSDRAVDTIIKRIRQKFREVDPTFDEIETIYGMGYRWRP